MKFGLFLISVLVSGCVALPDVYLIDRHTVMEAEASGEWPELERRLAQQALKLGPESLLIGQDDPRKKRAFSVLNGEFVVESKSQ
ncbi:MAG: hypothetical protein Q9O24_09175 [Gammaproteobacteria bacterium]|nr:hypothetical protein [Gammaproteobacteria bacterium]MDQ7075304.1 hypothetical protein [Gammaproteobacteria bacterium]